MTLCGVNNLFGLPYKDNKDKRAQYEECIRSRIVLEAALAKADSSKARFDIIHEFVNDKTGLTPEQQHAQSIIDSDILTYYKERNGYPLRKYDALTKTIGGVTYTYTGYTEITQMHYTPSSYKYITTAEIDEIEKLAEEGIIL